MDANHIGIGNIGTGNTSTLATFVRIPFRPHVKAANSAKMKRLFFLFCPLLLLVPVLSLAATPTYMEYFATNDTPSVLVNGMLVTNRLAEIEYVCAEAEGGGDTDSYEAVCLDCGVLVNRTWRSIRSDVRTIRRESLLVPYSDVPTNLTFGVGIPVGIEVAREGVRFARAVSDDYDPLAELFVNPAPPQPGAACRISAVESGRLPGEDPNQKLRAYTRKGSSEFDVSSTNLVNILLLSRSSKNGRRAIVLNARLNGTCVEVFQTIKEWSSLTGNMLETTAKSVPLDALPAETVFSDSTFKIQPAP